MMVFTPEQAQDIRLLALGLILLSMIRVLAFTTLGSIEIHFGRPKESDYAFDWVEFTDSLRREYHRTYG